MEPVSAYVPLAWMDGQTGQV